MYHESIIEKHNLIVITHIGIHAYYDILDICVIYIDSSMIKQAMILNTICIVYKIKISVSQSVFNLPPQRARQVFQA